MKLLPENDSQPIEPAQPENPIAAAVARLKESSLNALKRRGSVPQPLFWSLFNTELKEIKRKKAEARAFSSMFDPIE